MVGAQLSWPPQVVVNRLDIDVWKENEYFFQVSYLRHDLYAGRFTCNSELEIEVNFSTIQLHVACDSLKRSS